MADEAWAEVPLPAGSAGGGSARSAQQIAREETAGGLQRPTGHVLCTETLFWGRARDVVLPNGQRQARPSPNKPSLRCFGSPITLPPDPGILRRSPVSASVRQEQGAMGARPGQAGLLPPVTCQSRARRGALGGSASPPDLSCSGWYRLCASRPGGRVIHETVTATAIYGNYSIS
ncbi:hypothetical protein PVAR5_3939 [Paecilomyces variotii No. 5]|uniref:Uncharacterized protein n=1 Tax=Byssochlamys spectabilis (strain No. 5 / NBRC 109023) TaxID=1356009 RepID=V5G342_BYSSN|nr:hypothetical protein PVAR5_3939 [Paecilomyces variotii No. 5]